MLSINIDAYQQIPQQLVGQCKKSSLYYWIIECHESNFVNIEYPIICWCDISEQERMQFKYQEAQKPYEVLEYFDPIQQNTKASI